MAIPSTYHGPVHSMDSARAPGLEGEAKIPAHRGGGAALNMVPILLHALRPHLAALVHSDASALAYLP